jgi:hypothetical protein
MLSDLKIMLADLAMPLRSRKAVHDLWLGNLWTDPHLSSTTARFGDWLMLPLATPVKMLRIRGSGDAGRGARAPHP